MAQSEQERNPTAFKTLMEEKLGKHFDWCLPNLQNHVGPYDPSVFEDYEVCRSEVVALCSEKLLSFSNTDFLILAHSNFDDPDDARSDWQSFARDEIAKLNKAYPPWFAGGFGHPEYAADFEYWAQNRYFTNHEVLLLSLGVEPNHFGEERVSKIAEQIQKGAKFWEPIVFMVRRREQIEREFPTVVHRNRIDPQAFFDWVRLVKLVVHPQFTSRYLQTPNLSAKTATADGDARRAQTKPDRREIDKITQLFVTMAIRELGYDPTAKRSPIPKEIADLAADLGLNISDDTVRKYLQRGASFLPKDWKPN